MYPLWTKLRRIEAKEKNRTILEHVWVGISSGVRNLE